MRVLVVFDTTFGNTARVARAIGEALTAATGGHVGVQPAALVGMSDLAGLDLLVVGGPTQRHGPSRMLSGWLDGLHRGSLPGIRAAAFDTRYRMPRWLTGSTAAAIGRRLRHAGCALVVPPESFFMVRDEGSGGEKRQHAVEGLAPGELERAAAWARTLLAPVAG